MEQFSHDLTLALEETSRYSHYSGARSGKFGMRRRTRSTGNLRKLRFMKFWIMKNLRVFGMFIKEFDYLVVTVNILHVC